MAVHFLPSLLGCLTLCLICSGKVYNHGADDDILAVTEELLWAIGNNSFTNYAKLCADNMTIFEPPTSGQMITGLGFHEFFFDNVPPHKAYRQEILNPVVHHLGDDGAAIAYVRIIQTIDTSGVLSVESVPETRVWKKVGGGWRLVHSHRSVANIPLGSS